MAPRPPASGLRLQKVLARAGVASRRAADRLIDEGRVTVNGEVAVPGTRIDPAHDAVRVNGRRVRIAPPAPVYLVLYKPRRVVTTLKDPEGRPTVADLFVQGGVRRRVFPVGRLDYDAEGLLLVTDDGDLAQAVLHPSRGLPKVYHVKVRGAPDAGALERLRRGIGLGDRTTTRPARVETLRPGDNPWLAITLKEGRPNQIRRMLLRIGHRVLRIRRVAIGPLRLTGLRPGQVRPLREAELRGLRGALGLRPRERPPGDLDATR